MEVIGSIYTGASDDFQRGVYPIARCVKAEKHDLGIIMADVNVIGSLEAKFESTNRIYDVGGCSPTLSTMQGGNQEPKILESQIVAMRGRNPDNPSDRALGSLTEQRLEVNMQDTSNCLTSAQKDNLLLEKPQYRIRKLTPRECGRLMSVSDEDIDKMAAVNSNTQLYKQFGNSIVVDVMCAMFKNLNIKQGDSNEALQTN